MILAFLYVKWKKKCQNYNSGVFMYIIEKKNAGNNDSGIFICIFEKKMPELMIPAFLYVNEKKC
jgi:hypothetical protein